MDAIVKYAQENGINILFILSYNPSFYGIGGIKTNACIDPAHIDKWMAFVTAMVNRYDGEVDGAAIDMPGLTKPIKHWSMWNEPNLLKYWNTVTIIYSDLKCFVDWILAPGITAIRTADSTAKICGPDLSSSTANGDPIK